MNPAPNVGCRGHILLVDDNAHGLLARKTLLEELGYRIATAGNGEEALALFAESPFDVVVTDFRMPAMNGGELIRRIRQTRPATGVVLLSGFVEPLGLTEQSTGADVVIPKSAGEIRHLVRAVDRLLESRVPRKGVARQRGASARRAAHAG